MKVKEMVGIGLTFVGSGIAGWGFGKRDAKIAVVGTFIMGLGTVFITDAHTDAINQHAKVLNDHEERLRRSEN
jgi:hypothetical protein